MSAVLVDAIRCLAWGSDGRSDRVHLAAQARRWIAAVDALWPYSFQNICAALDLDPSRVRARLLSSGHTVRSVLERLEKHLLAS